MTDGRDAALALAFMERQAMADTRSYVGNGRRFRKLNKPDLDTLWAAAFADFCSYGDPRRRTDLHDLSAELELRDLPKPHELACKSVEMARRRLRDTREKHPGKPIAQSADLAKVLIE